jgi:hypothetical protein
MVWLSGEWDDMFCSDVGAFICGPTTPEPLQPPLSLPLLPPPGQPLLPPPGQPLQPPPSQPAAPPPSQPSQQPTQPATPGFGLTVLGQFYTLFDTDATSTWDGARKRCQSLGLDLASISTKEMDNALYLEVSRVATQNWYFVGGTDSGSEGDWRWLNGAPWSHTNWEVRPRHHYCVANMLLLQLLCLLVPGMQADRPDNFRDGQNCLGVWMSSGDWDDFFCSDIGAFVCGPTTPQSLQPPPSLPLQPPPGQPVLPPPSQPLQPTPGQPLELPPGQPLQPLPGQPLQPLPGEPAPSDPDQMLQPPPSRLPLPPPSQPAQPYQPGALPAEPPAGPPGTSSPAYNPPTSSLLQPPNEPPLPPLPPGASLPPARPTSARAAQSRAPPALGRAAAWHRLPAAACNYPCLSNCPLAGAVPATPAGAAAPPACKAGQRLAAGTSDGCVACPDGSASPGGSSGACKPCRSGLTNADASACEGGP